MEQAAEFAGRIKGLGFKVYIAERGAHGYITDETESRVLSWSLADGGSLSGNYGPPSRESGTGWRLNESPWQLTSAHDVRRALNAQPEAFCGKGWRYLCTVAQYLAQYGDSSKFREI